VGEIVFDPFESPWQPQPRPEGRSGEAANPAPAAPAIEPAAKDLRAALHTYERGLIEQALDRCRWNQRLTAPELGLTYDQLRHAMKRHGLIERR
jgi:psp operon transcriptional activator